MHDKGLIQLLQTIPMVKKIDLEGAAEITDRVISALTPPNDVAPDALFTGNRLEHLIISYACNLSDGALVKLIHHCSALTVLMADNTRITDEVQREFLAIARERQAYRAELSVIDCRGISRSMTGLLDDARPRRGRSGYLFRQMEYFDNARLQEYDESKVVLHSFSTWADLDSAAKFRRWNQEDLSQPRRRALNVNRLLGSERDSDFCIIS